LFELAGPEAVKDNYFSTHFAPDDKDPAVQQFVTAYTAKYHKAPGAMAALGYDGILVIADAFKRAGSSDAEALKKALAGTTGFLG
ncbi:ABC transporter substrate-binding protein, partial [Klebsiella pneumoniae]